MKVYYPRTHPLGGRQHKDDSLCTHKFCTYCKEVKSLECFDMGLRDGAKRCMPYCKPCRKIYVNKRFASREEDKKSNLYSSIKRRYGLNKEAYLKLINYQESTCWICGSPPNIKSSRPSLHVDHDHKVGNVRGLLCAACNHFLGHAKDNKDRIEKILKNAIQYLEDNGETVKRLIA